MKWKQIHITRRRRKPDDVNTYQKQQNYRVFFFFAFSPWRRGRCDSRDRDGTQPDLCEIRALRLPTGQLCLPQQLHLFLQPIVSGTIFGKPYFQTLKN